MTTTTVFRSQASPIPVLHHIATVDEALVKVNDESYYYCYYYYYYYYYILFLL